MMKYSDIRIPLTEKIDPAETAKQFGDFIKFCKAELKLDTLPQFKWLTGDVGHGQPSFGAYHHDKTISLSILNRHPLDVMRTLAHELCHYKQHLENKLDHRSGETGSPIENEANAMAGVIMRKWGKKNPDMFKTKPIIRETAIKLRNRPESTKTKSWIDKMYSLYAQNPLNPKQLVMMYDKGRNELAKVELVGSPFANTVEIRWFETSPQGSGVGTKAMADLQKHAAADGISLVLWPWDDGPVPRNALINFYEKMGFRQNTEDDDMMMWRPAGIRLNESSSLCTAVVKDILDAVPDCFEIWLHGSRATGKHRRNSDWDVLVIVPATIRGGNYIDIVKKLQSISAEHLGFDIQPSHPNDMIARTAREEGTPLWRKLSESEKLDAPTPTVAQLAKKYNCTQANVKELLVKGIKVEREHTNKDEVAREIALDHLGEDLNYYDKLSKIEKKS